MISAEAEPASPNRPEGRTEIPSIRQPEIPVVTWGDVALASHPFSTQWTTDMIVDQLPENERAEGRAAIEATGITTRYFRDFSVPVTPESVVDESSRNSALLVRRVMDAKGWNSIDVLVDTSAMLPLTFSESLSRRMGFDLSRLERRSYRPACAGTAIAFGDALMTNGWHGKRVVIIAAEPISDIVDLRVLTLPNIGIPAIFGDDYAALAFDPGNFKVSAIKTRVIPDNGVIRIRPLYELPSSDTTLLPPHYELTDGAGSIFSINHDGVFMRYRAPDGDIPASMDGPATAKFFIRHTPPVIIDVLREAQSLGVYPENVIAHQPSLPVVTGINRVLERSGFAQKIPFLLNKMGRSNSSGATTAVTWQYLAREGLIDPAKPTLIAAPGVGSIITACVIQPS